MIRLNFLILSFLLLSSILAFSESAMDHFDMYASLNESETRYMEYKDSDEVLRLKLIQLDHINTGRIKYNAQPVKLDILASRVANKISKEGVIEGFMGHWNTRGETPNHRYAFAGGLDHIMENMGWRKRTADFEQSNDKILSLMKDANNRFMGEHAPNDGHKKNCINPLHNYVGIGFHLEGKHFRYYEEYIDRYLEFKDVKNSIKTGETYSISVKPISDDHSLYFVNAYYSSFPSAMTPNQINRKNSYSEHSANETLRLAPWELPKKDSEGWTNFTFTFTKSGLYYLNIYLSKKPWTEGGFSTRGKIQASGVIIQVE
jgi:hypothetical protein